MRKNEPVSLSTTFLCNKNSSKQGNPTRFPIENDLALNYLETLTILNVLRLVNFHTTALLKLAWSEWRRFVNVAKVDFSSMVANGRKDIRQPFPWLHTNFLLNVVMLCIVGKLANNIMTRPYWFPLFRKHDIEGKTAFSQVTWPGTSLTHSVYHDLNLKWLKMLLKTL